ncbi:(R)-hydratase [Caulobacter sp. CCUG 60055]|uniref:MaoC family dehydratase n=1 Tax=Caulobacter sp. CCUG 60055 TaxID=2100090 RepID=UPI001FA79914|nr:MaoC family dehydratase [Caulobacter sp. CCUG 60055]MBQ1543591.1 MaoC family dehydratase [Caulobacteraceae bacterium]MCI3181490.1 (R)-hydratase [Caulobacter sp. CCUG 60055]
MAGLYLEDLSVGQSATLSRTVSEGDIVRFAEVSGDHNPVHLDEAYAANTPFKTRIAHGMLGASFISALLAGALPGPGAIYLSQSLAFKRPVKIGDEVTVTATITAVDEAKARVTLATVASVNGKAVIEGEAVVMAPRKAG